jgi:FAD/FMN-containing dehydrogenase
MSKITTVEQAQDFLRHAQAQGHSVLPCGRGSRRARLSPEQQPDQWLSLAGLQQIHWIDAEDRTCEVDAGLSPAALDQALAPLGLMLGVLSAGSTKGTLGGLFLSGEPSLLAGSCGLPRDQVLGATWMLTDGSVVGSGARVVKSVAGYDVTRLYLGSRGRLAACLRLILRLRPRPNDLRWAELDPQELRAIDAPRPWIDFALPAENGDPGRRWAAWEGCAPLGPSAAALQTNSGPLPVAKQFFPALQTALQSAESAQHWLASPRRLTLDSSGGLEQSGCLLIDYLARQSAWSRDPRSLDLPDGCVSLPHSEASPWVKKLAHASAPNSPAFGLPT